MTLRNLKIYRAQGQHVAALLPMVKALARHHGDTPRATKHSLRRAMEYGAVILLAEQAGHMIGYAAMLPLAQMQFGARGMDIHHLFVKEGQRGAGVGRALVMACRAHVAAQCGQYLMVGTHPENVAAQAAYKSWGFAERPAGGPRFMMQVT